MENLNNQNVNCNENWKEIFVKLANGEITLEGFMDYKIDLFELVEFAKQQEMDWELIRKVSYMKKLYKVYIVPFEKDKYLAETIIIVDGKDVKPTENDVDACIEYLKKSGEVICEQNVSETVRKYLRGEIDINLSDKKEEKSQAADESNNSLTELAEEEEKQRKLLEKRKRIEQIMELMARRRESNVK